MIVINGKSGSSKTSTIKALTEHGYKVLTTYTTRPIRQEDVFGTVHIEPDKFKKILLSGGFLTHASYDSAFGTISYGMMCKDLMGPTMNIVVAGAIEYMQDFEDFINRQKKDKLFKVYLDVSDDTIIEMSYKTDKNGGRTDANRDIRSRLTRDRDKMVRMKESANLVISNPNLTVSTEKIVNTIMQEHLRFLKEVKM